MRLKAQRRAIYVAMGLTVLALTGGYALASVSLGQGNGVQQGSQTTTISPVTGLSWVSTELALGNSAEPNSTCTLASPCDVSSHPVYDCAGGYGSFNGCSSTDWVEQVTLTTVNNVALNGTVNLTLYVTIGGFTYTGTSFFYKDASPNPPEPIIQDFGVGDLSSGPGAVTSVSLVATPA